VADQQLDRHGETLLESGYGCADVAEIRRKVRCREVSFTFSETREIESQSRNAEPRERSADRHGSLAARRACETMGKYRQRPRIPDGVMKDSVELMTVRIGKFDRFSVHTSSRSRAGSGPQGPV